MANEQLEADAKAFLVRRYTNIDGWLSDGWLERMTSFAAEQIAAERERVAVLENALQNVYLMSARGSVRKNNTEREQEEWGHLLRFCRDAGIVGSILREAK